jgi:hypothetical protein
VLAGAEDQVSKQLGCLLPKTVSLRLDVCNFVADRAVTHSQAHSGAAVTTVYTKLNRHSAFYCGPKLGSYRHRRFLTKLL